MAALLEDAQRLIDIWDPKVQDAQRFPGLEGRDWYDAAVNTFKDQQPEDFSDGIPFYNSKGEKNIVIDEENRTVNQSHIPGLMTSFLTWGIMYEMRHPCFVRWTLPRNMPLRAFAWGHFLTAVYRCLESPEHANHPRVVTARKEGLKSFIVFAAKIPVSTLHNLKSFSNAEVFRRSLVENVVEWYLTIAPLAPQWKVYIGAHSIDMADAKDSHPKQLAFYLRLIANDDIRAFFRKKISAKKIGDTEETEGTETAGTEQYVWEKLNVLISMAKALTAWELLGPARSYLGANQDVSPDGFLEANANFANIWHQMKVIVDKCSGSPQIDGRKKAEVEQRNQIFQAALWFQLFRRSIVHRPDCPDHLPEKQIIFDTRNGNRTTSYLKHILLHSMKDSKAAEIEDLVMAGQAKEIDDKEKLAYKSIRGSSTVPLKQIRTCDDIRSMGFILKGDQVIRMIVPVVPLSET